MSDNAIANQLQSIAPPSPFEAHGGLDPESVDLIHEVSNEEADSRDEAVATVERYMAIRARRAASLEVKKANMKRMIEREERKLDRLDQLYMPLAEAVTKHALANVKKKRSIDFPAGRLGFRAVGQSIEIPKDREAEAIAACEANPDLADAVKVVKSLLKTPIADHIKKTGEVPDWVTVNDPYDKFYVQSSAIPHDDIHVDSEILKDDPRVTSTLRIIDQYTNPSAA
jgi:hypothetical protein